jgi:ankyrin repeat protein
MNIFDTKRGLNLAAMLLGTSSMVAPSLHALTQAEENAKDLIDNWRNYSTNRNGSHVDFIERVLNERNVALYHQNEDGDTLLHLAVRDGDVQSVELLMKNGAPQYIKNNNDEIPAAIARTTCESWKDNAQRHKDKQKQVRLYIQATMKKYAAIYSLLKKAAKKAQENTKELMGRWLTFNPLGRGSIKSMIDTAIKNGGVTPFWKNENDDNLLHMFASFGDRDAVELLLKYKFSPLEKNKDDRTPLDLAKKALTENEKALTECQNGEANVKMARRSNATTIKNITNRIENCKETIALLEQAEEEMAGFRGAM